MALQPVVLVAGPGDSSVAAGFVDGNYTEARFNSPIGMVMGRDGFTAYICDYGNHAIRALDTRTRDVTTYAVGSPLVYPIHLAIGRSGSLYVACAENGDRNSPVVKITPGRTMSIVGQGHQPRGIAVNEAETMLYFIEQGHFFFTELWRSAYAEMDMGGNVTDRSELGTFIYAEGGCLAPDGYFYGVAPNTYYYSSGAGFKRFTPGGTNTWNESGAPPNQSYGIFASPSGGDYGNSRRACAVRNGSDGRMWFYNTSYGHVFLTKIDSGDYGGIHSDEQIGSLGSAWGICLNSQDTVYFSACGLHARFASIQGSSSVVFYDGVGSGLNSIYLVGCPPNESAVASEHSSRVVVDDGVQLVRAKLRGAPKVLITENRDNCGRPLPAQMTKPEMRLRARQP